MGHRGRHRRASIRRMLEEDAAPECPWCSASLTPGQTVCGSCGANLSGDAGGDIPGVTEIDKSAVGVARPPAITTGAAGGRGSAATRATR